MWPKCLLIVPAGIVVPGAAKKLNITATVKCVSDINITEKVKDSARGDVYYIISSDSVLTLFARKDT